MATEIPVTRARAELAELVNRVAYSGERVALTRHGRTVAGIVSAEELELLERLLAGMTERGHGPVSASPESRDPQPRAVPGDPMRIAAHYRPPGPPPGRSGGGTTGFGP